MTMGRYSGLSMTEARRKALLERREAGDQLIELHGAPTPNLRMWVKAGLLGVNIPILERGRWTTQLFAYSGVRCEDGTPIWTPQNEPRTKQ